MKGRLTKVLSLSLICSMLFSMTALADVPLSSEGSATGTAPSEFSVEDAESSAVVRLPANLDLDFSEELGAFQIVSNVGVYGDIKDFSEISVSINEDLIYSDGQLSDEEVAWSGNYNSAIYKIPNTAENEYEINFYYTESRDYNCTVNYFKFTSDTPLFLVKTASNTYSGTLYDGYDGGTYKLATYANGNVIILAGDISKAFNVMTSTMKSSNMHGWYKVDSYNNDGSIYTSGNISSDMNSKIQDNSGYNYDYLSAGNGWRATISKASNAGVAPLVRFGQFHCDKQVFSSTAAAQNFFDYDADNYNYVTGKVLFGENANGVCTETWNSEQAAAGLTNHDVNGEDDTDYRTIMVNVPNYEVTASGTYFATAEFEINFTCVGMKSDIGATTKLSGKEIKESDNSYAWDEDYTSTASMVNLGRMGNKPFVISTSALKDNTSMQNIEHIQLADNTTTSYLTYIDDANPANCNSWLMGMHGVQVLVIPKSVTTEQLHKTAGNTRTINQDTALVVNNSVTAVFDETNTKIGNAMCFVKNIDANNKFIYVPHICYRGTKDEFKALSGYDNWVFGNKGNIITVHCTDGMMYY